jgi:hypothetical protein
MRLTISACLILILGACVHQPIDPSGPSYQSVKLIRDARFPAVALGDFGVGRDPAIGSRSISIRGSTMRPPKGGTFATFLRDTMQAQLFAAGRYDPAARIVVAADLVRNHAGENMATGTAVLAARFKVVRNGQIAFERLYEVENRWKSEFIGAIAIPEAFQQYNALYGQLVSKVLTDPDFGAAIRGEP